MRKKRAPLKDRPLRNPGQSLHEQGRALEDGHLVISAREILQDVDERAAWTTLIHILNR